MPTVAFHCSPVVLTNINMVQWIQDKSDSMSTKAPTGHIRPGLSSYTAPTPNVDNDDGISNDGWLLCSLIRS